MKNSGLQRSPLDLIEHDHAKHSHLCDDLEQIADSLPDDVDKKLCQQVAMTLRFDLPLHHLDEENGLFPLLHAHSEQKPSINPILNRLSEEHAADESFAEELIEELDHLALTGKAKNAETLGYMLRGFFESYRRHMHWEQTILMPMARQILTGDDLQRLSDIMARHRRPEIAASN